MPRTPTCARWSSDDATTTLRRTTCCPPRHHHQQRQQPDAPRTRHVLTFFIALFMKSPRRKFTDLSDLNVPTRCDNHYERHHAHGVRSPAATQPAHTQHAANPTTHATALTLALFQQTPHATPARRSAVASDASSGESAICKNLLSSSPVSNTYYLRITYVAQKKYRQRRRS